MLALIIVIFIRKMIKDKKQGKSSCDGNCPMDAAAIKNKGSFYQKISFFGDGFGDSTSEGKANAF